MRCQHAGFSVQANVTRLTDGDGGPVTGYTTDITVKCADCGLPFRWLGLPGGSHHSEPRVSADALELRAPIEPAHVPEIMGIPTISGRA